LPAAEVEDPQTAAEAAEAAIENQLKKLLSEK
jgi:hypothetical protein